MKTLARLRVLNTRPKEQASLLSRNIIEAGGRVIECPLLDIIATPTQWINEQPLLTDVDIALFTSPNAVRFCFDALNQKKILWPEQIHVIAIGQATAHALQKYSISEVTIPNIPDSEHVLELDVLQEITHKTVVLFKGIGGRTLIETSLYNNTHFSVSEVYERTLPQINSELIQSIWQESLVDIILLTSEEAMNHLFLIFGPAAHQWLYDTPCLVLGPRLAKAALLLGIKNVIISRPERIMETLFDHYEGLIHDQ